MPPSVDNTASGERIAKLLARAGVASRREIERMIADGRVARDGVAIDTPATLLRSLHGVTVDGDPVAAPAPARLFLYHKPPGLLVTERDPAGRPTIYDRLPQGYGGDLPRVVPVGRLDLNTEGLLLLTTDGGLKRELELPATGVERAYRARAYGPVSQAQLEELIEGVEIDGVRYGAIDANLERRTGANSWIELVLTEGKNREVRRVLEFLGLEVSRLIRTRYGPFVLGDLPPGAVGEVRQVDLIAFRQALAGKRPAGPERVSVQPTAPRATVPPGDGDGDRAALSHNGAASRSRTTARPTPAPAPAPARSIAERSAGTNPGEGRGSAAMNPKRRDPAAQSPPGRAAQTHAARPHARDPKATAEPRRGPAPASPGRRSAAAGSAERLDRETRTDRAGRPTPAAPQSGPGPRRGGTEARSAAPDRARKPSSASATRSLSDRANRRETSPPDGERVHTARPAKPPLRKIGWAKPKPKPGPRRPGKPR